MRTVAALGLGSLTNLHLVNFCQGEFSAELFDRLQKVRKSSMMIIAAQKKIEYEAKY